MYNRSRSSLSNHSRPTVQSNPIQSDLHGGISNQPFDDQSALFNPPLCPSGGSTRNPLCPVIDSLPRTIRLNFCRPPPRGPGAGRPAPSIPSPQPSSSPPGGPGPTDDVMVMASEVGVVDPPPQLVKQKGRLMPGRGTAGDPRRSGVAMQCSQRSSSDSNFWSEWGQTFLVWDWGLSFTALDDGDAFPSLENSHYGPPSHSWVSRRSRLRV